jgi:hypothetical protein
MSDAALRVGDPSVQDIGGVLTAAANIKDTLKTGMVDKGLPIGFEGLQSFGQNVARVDHDIRATQKTNMVDQPLPHQVISNPQLQTELVTAALSTIRDTLKTEEGLPVNAPSYQIIGGVLTAAANIKDTLKTGMVDSSLRVGDPSRAEQGSIITELATIRPTQKYDHELFPIGAINPIAKGGVIITEHNIRDTLKTEDTFRVGDPSLQNSGGVLTSQATIRPTQKNAEFSFRVGDPAYESAGGILTEVASIRPTLRIHAEDSFRTGGIDSIAETGYLQLDKYMPETRRMTMPVLSHQPCPDGQQLGDFLPIQNLTTKQVRGTMVNQYIPENSHVMDGIGGSNDRVISAMQQLRPKTNTFFYTNPDQSYVLPNTSHLIPSMRLTTRAINDMKDLLNVQECS